MKSKIFLLYFFILQIGISYSQITPEWVSTYSNSNDLDAGITLTQDAFGNIFVTGVAAFENTTDIVTIKYDPNGIRQWVKIYHPGENSYSEPADIAVDGSGNVYITGYSNYDFVTIKYNTSGDQIWLKRYHGPNNQYSDKSHAIALDKNDNVYITGGSRDGDYNYDITSIKYDSSGVQKWIQRYDGPGNQDDIGNSITVDQSGNIYLTGYSIGDSTFSDICTIKYDTEGQQQWVKRFDGEAGLNDGGNSILTDDNGNVYVSGYSSSSFIFKEYITIKYNSSGDELWVQKYGTNNSYNELSSMAIDLRGNVYVTGKSDDQDGNSFDYATIKYDPSGVQQWVNRYNGTENWIDVPSSVVAGKNGYVYVTGYSYGTEINSDIVTIAIDSLGIQKWIERRDGSAHNSDQGAALIIDSSDNIFLTGSIMETGTYVNFITIKYSQTTGINNISNEIPVKFSLHQNYPNPFNPVTKIKFDISQDDKRGIQNVKLVVFDMLGKEVMTIVNEALSPGSYEADFDGSNFSSGVYFYKLSAGSFIETKRMLLLK